MGQGVVIRGAILAGAILTLGCSTAPPVDDVDAFGAHALAQAERRIAASERDATTERRSHELIRTLAIAAPADLRIYALRDAAASADLYRSGMLVIHGGLAPQPDAALAFVLAHELAHHALLHFKRRDEASQAARAEFAEPLEFEADAAAMQAVSSLPDRCNAIDAMFALRQQQETEPSARDLVARRRSALMGACITQ